MITEDKVIEIFYMADEYSREFSKIRQKYSLEDGRNDGKRRRNKLNRMSDAEIMVILILFHTGGFCCFKLHLIINDRGEILNFMITPGNTDDREPLRDNLYLQDIKGKLCGDRGYIGRALFELLFINGIQLVTRVRNNMRNMLMSAEDKILLRKRAVIETVNDELKNIAQIEHSRHRSFNNFIVNILSAIAAYCFFPKKPAVDVAFVDDGQLVLF